MSRRDATWATVITYERTITAAPFVHRRGRIGVGKGEKVYPVVPVSDLFPTLFSPFEVRGKRFKNRIFLPAHGTGYADAGTVGDRGLAYYRARITRGISLLITEATHVVALEEQNTRSFPWPAMTVFRVCNDLAVFVPTTTAGSSASSTMKGEREPIRVTAVLM